MSGLKRGVGVQVREGGGVSAVLSDCGRYRYALTRDILELGNEGTVCFIMLNPSTADASIDDPTIRRCIGFARRWGYARLTVANLYAFRATDPKALERADDPVGPYNDEWIRKLAWRATEVVAAWGAHRMAERRESLVLNELMPFGCGPSCLGQTKSLAPRHPLYVRGDIRPTPLRRYARMPEAA